MNLESVAVNVKIFSSPSGMMIVFRCLTISGRILPQHYGLTQKLSVKHLLSSLAVMYHAIISLHYMHKTLSFLPSTSITFALQTFSTRTMSKRKRGSRDGGEVMALQAETKDSTEDNSEAM